MSKRKSKNTKSKRTKSTKKTKKRERCPNGSNRNKQSGTCEPKQTKLTSLGFTREKLSIAERQKIKPLDSIDKIALYIVPRSDGSYSLGVTCEQNNMIKIFDVKSNTIATKYALRESLNIFPLSNQYTQVYASILKKAKFGEKGSIALLRLQPTMNKLLNEIINIKNKVEEMEEIIEDEVEDNEDIDEESNKDNEDNEDKEDENHDVAVMELYQFELKGYPNTPMTKSMFYDIEFAEKSTCGIIESEHAQLETFNRKLSSCDIIHSPKVERKIISPPISRLSSHAAQPSAVSSVRESRPKTRGEPLVENFVTKHFKNENTPDIFHTNDFYRFYLKYAAKGTEVLKDNNVWKDKYNDCKSELADALHNNIQYINAHSSFKVSISDINSVNKLDERMHAEGMIYNIKTNNKEKIVVFGDFHGSFHTFLRNIFRLYKCGAITNLDTFELNPKWKIIFLGDVVDRGHYCLEILLIILKMMNSNNTPTELRVILNRGNHEEVSIYTDHGFDSEMKAKMSKNDYKYFRFYIFHFFTYLSSAIFLTNVDTNNNYWLSHGGIPIMEDLKLKPFTSQITINNYDQYIANQIRWNDFYNREKNICNSSRSCECSGKTGCFKLSPHYFIDFMRKNNIQFIIRGHQDSTANFYLLSSVVKNDGALIMDDIKDIEVNSSVYFNNNQSGIKNRNAVYGPISRVNIDAMKWDNNMITGSIPTIDSEKVTLGIYPVITISTNTDYGRMLSHDSFGIIRFDLDKSTANNFSEKNNIIDTRNK